MGDVKLSGVGLLGIGPKLLASASVFALGILGAAAPAWAQEVVSEPVTGEQPGAIEPTPQTGASEGQQEEVADGDVIIVTGIRASLRSARDTKKNAEQIVNSISAQDIGALPDRSVSEALQRIPGVTLQRTNAARDPARLSAEGGAIFIRGLSWVRSEVNGRDVFSANNGRALSFEDVPADLLAGVDVYKNPSANLIEGGIGGLVNLRTRKPFDQSGQLIAGSVDYNYADLREKGFWSGNLLYSNRWETGIGDIGILLSGSINNIGNRTDSVQTGDYTARTVPAARSMCPSPSASAGLTGSKSGPLWTAQFNGRRPTIFRSPLKPFMQRLRRRTSSTTSEILSRRSRAAIRPMNSMTREYWNPALWMAGCSISTPAGASESTRHRIIRPTSAGSRPIIIDA